MDHMEQFHLIQTTQVSPAYSFHSHSLSYTKLCEMSFFR